MDEPKTNLAELIGHVTIIWNEIESWMVDIAWHLVTVIDYDFDEDQKRELFLIPFIQHDLRNRIAVNKALAIKATNEFAPDLYSKTETLLNFIDNTLRPERNRYVHDEWSGREGAITRIQYGIKIKRSRSRQVDLNLSTHTSFRNIAAISSFIDHLNDVVDELEELDSFIVWLGYSAKRLKGSREQLPGKWKCLTRRDWQDRDMP